MSEQVALIIAELLRTASDVYADRLMGPVTGGMVSMASFLLASYSFVIIKMKEGVYDTPQWRAALKSKASSIGQDFFIYDALGNLSDCLLRVIRTCFIVAALQPLAVVPYLGLIPAIAAGVAIVKVVRAIGVIRNNMMYYFDSLRRDPGNTVRPYQRKDGGAPLTEVERYETDAEV